MRRLFGYHPPSSSRLRKANANLSAGDYQSASLSYEALFSHADFRSRPQLAFLYIQAGRARMMAGNFSTAFSHIHRGLELLVEHRRYAQLYQIAGRVKSEFEQRGLEREVRMISALVHSNMMAVSELPTQLVDQHQVRIPGNCPACGADLSIVTVYWLDARVAECPLCASPLDAL